MVPKPKKHEKKVPVEKRPERKDARRLTAKEREEILIELARRAGLVR